MIKGYELGNCPRCQKPGLVIVYDKVVCKFCNNWSWLEDARNSSWLKEVKEDKCDNDHDCEHCDWTECPEMKGE